MGGSLGKTGDLFSGQSFTVETWVKIYAVNEDNQGDNAIIGTKSFGEGSGLHCILRGATPVLGFYCNDTGASRKLTINCWTHLAFVYDLEAREQRIFIDGELAGMGEGKAPLIGNYDVFIGTWAFGGRYLNGEMLLLNLWRTARSAEQIQQSCLSGALPTADSESLVASWTFHLEDNESFRMDAVSGKRENLQAGCVVEVEDPPF